jgi:hypothetical protein
MDTSRARAEELLTLSGAARRIADLIAASEAPLRYEVIRHLVRVSEEDLIDTLQEAVAARLIRRGPDPSTYVPFDDATGIAIRDCMDEQRLMRLRTHIASATARVFE